MRISDWSSDVCSSDLRDVVDLDKAVLRALADQVEGKQRAIARIDPGQRHRYGRLPRVRIADEGDARRKIDGAVRLKVEERIGQVEPAQDRKSTRLNSSHSCAPRMPSSA